MNWVPRALALWLTGRAQAFLPVPLREWGRAMRSEALRADGDVAALRFALGCLAGAARIAIGHHIGEPAGPVVSRARTWSRHVGAASPLRTICLSLCTVTLAGAAIMFHATDLNLVLTNLTLAFAFLKVASIVVLLLHRRRIVGMFDDGLTACLYFTSKLCGVLTVAFALAAAASVGRVTETYCLAALLVIATALTFWTVFARVTGRFYGLAQIGSPA